MELSTEVKLTPEQRAAIARLAKLQLLDDARRVAKGARS